MARGRLFGGWRIVRMMGPRITKLQSIGGFLAESGEALTLSMRRDLVLRYR
ncbi:inorganic phosphate transporter [Caballeronia novacaledonica]|uniref:inorganic phosphate transporter n=1 Tax=Caballeronia novacaledonica TaxID=1544861 RepID=UPI001EDF86A6